MPTIPPPLQVTHVYTTNGPQRAVLLKHERRYRFSLALLPGDVGWLELSWDEGVPGHARIWERFEGGLGGDVQQVGALRAVMPQNNGWAALTVVEVTK